MKIYHHQGRHEDKVERKQVRFGLVAFGFFGGLKKTIAGDMANNFDGYLCK
jgi:hypothetical protein